MGIELQLLLLMTLFQVKHCFADFVLQTYQQTVKKGQWLNPVGISHSVEHGYCTAVVLLIFSLFVTLSISTILVVVFLETVVHYIIDFIKVKHGSKDQTKPIFWTQFGLDQLLHQFTYIAIIWYII